MSVKRWARGGAMAVAAASLLAVGFVGCGDDGGNEAPPTSGTFVDARDGRGYKWVAIGSQVWMAENLNYAGAGVCYESNEAYCAAYGRLYTWIEAMGIDATYANVSWLGSDAGHQGICPVGWHLPSDGEWARLTSYAGGKAGSELKSKTGWDISGTDEYGFSALPGGFGSLGVFLNGGEDGYWWSATENDAMSAWSRDIPHLYDVVNKNPYPKSFALSVRCLRN